MQSDKESLDLILQRLEKKLDLIHQNTKHMEEHINFVENTYDKVKTPFHYLMDKINLLSFSPFRRSEIVHDESSNASNATSNATSNTTSDTRTTRTM